MRLLLIKAGSGLDRLFYQRVRRHDGGCELIIPVLQISRRLLVIAVRLLPHIRNRLIKPPDKPHRPIEMRDQDHTLLVRVVPDFVATEVI